MLNVLFEGMGGDTSRQWVMKLVVFMNCFDIRNHSGEFGGHRACTTGYSQINKDYNVAAMFTGMKMEFLCWAHACVSIYVSYLFDAWCQSQFPLLSRNIPQK